MARRSQWLTGARSGSTPPPARSGRPCHTLTRCCRWSSPPTGPAAEYVDGGRGAAVGPKGGERDGRPAVGRELLNLLPDGQLIRLVGILLIMVAIILAFLYSDRYGPTGLGYALSRVIGLAGVLCWGYGIALSWWHHG